MVRKLSFREKGTDNFHNVLTFEKNLVTTNDIYTHVKPQRMPTESSHIIKMTLQHQNDSRYPGV